MNQAQKDSHFDTLNSTWHLPIDIAIYRHNDILTYSHHEILTYLYTKQAKGLGFINQAQKDSHVDNNYKFAIYSLHL